MQITALAIVLAILASMTTDATAAKLLKKRWQER